MSQALASTVILAGACGLAAVIRGLCALADWGASKVRHPIYIRILFWVVVLCGLWALIFAALEV